MSEPLLVDDDAIKRTIGVAHRGSVTSVERSEKEELEIEDALDRVGGVGKFQLYQFFFAGMFWFLSPSILFSVFANGPCIGARQACEYDSANTGAVTDCCGDVRSQVGAESCGVDAGICFETVTGVPCATTGGCASLDEAACVADADGTWTDTCWDTVDGANVVAACGTLVLAATTFQEAQLQCTAGGGVLGMADFPECEATCPDPDSDNPLCPAPTLPGDPDQSVCPLLAPNAEYWSACKSIACQFDLTATRAYLRPLLDSSFFLGWLWGAPVAGRISDKYGRYFTLYLTFSVNAIGVLSSTVAPGVYWYMFSRHLTGAGLGGSSLTAYLIGTEYSPRSRATLIKTGWSLFSVCGYIWQSFFAKWLYYSLPGYNWRLQHLILFAPYLVCTIISAFVLSESPRWLLVNRGVPAATAALAKVGYRNGSEAAVETFKLRAPITTADENSRDGLRDLFCVPSLRRRMLATLVLWFAASFSYYGLTLRAEALPGNVFNVFAIMSSVEVPAVILLVPMLNARAIGRQRGTLGLFFCLGFGSFANVIWTSPTGGLTLNIAGRAFSGAAFSAVYVWSTEIFPSSLRQTAMGMGSMSARVGSVIAPFAVELWGILERLGGFSAPDGPLLLFGSAGIVAGIVGFMFLPETRGRVTPETVADMLVEEEELRQKKHGCCCK